MTKAQMQKRMDDLMECNDLLRLDIERHQNLLDETQREHNESMSKEIERFHTYNDFSLVNGLNIKCNEFLGVIESLQSQLDYYKGKEESSVKQYIDKLEKHILKLSLEGRK